MRNLLLFFTFTFLLLLLGNRNIAQTNLVLNYSFEDYTICPKPEDSTVFVIYTPPWYSPTENTPDLYNECSNLNNSVPNTFCGFQYPRTGKGFAGFAWDYAGNCDYFTGKFSSPLANGKKYCVEFYVNLADYSFYAFDRIGAYISTDSLHFSGGAYGYLHFIPQVENPAGNIITDTVNWTLISGEYIATGGEKFITIGNFRPDSLVQYIKFDTTINSYYPYYYLDDVSVILCDTDSVGINEKMDNKGNFSIYPNPVMDYISIELLNTAGINEKMIISVYDIQGQLLIQQDIKQINTRVDVSMLAKGVYIAKVETSTNTLFKKLVKQ